MFKDILFSPFRFLSELFKGNLIKKYISLKDLGKTLSGWLDNTVEKLLDKFNLQGTPIGNFATKMSDWTGNVISSLLGGIENTFSDVSSVLQGDMSFKDFVFRLVDRVFGGIGDAVNSFFIRNPIGSFIKANIFIPLTEFFAGIGDFFQYIKAAASNPLELAGSILTGSFGSGLEEFKAKEAENRRQQRRISVVDEYKNELGEAYNQYNRIRDKSSTEAIAKRNDLINSLLDRNLVNPKLVNDAIVKPSGQIIVPHKDDTIIATKNPVSNRGSYTGNDNEIQDFLTEKIIKDSDNRIISTLEKIVSAIEEKPFNNIVSNTTTLSNDFDKLRFAF